ncbi:hypothetical protein AB1Y20_021185 [Prymnesium parvum]|uniref:Glycosyl transferase CAP10 domain-containing protein n=1 Tax=Prymnesium parvum TaxID=97485 RepID=A0AB34JI10_PRYPA
MAWLAALAAALPPPRPNVLLLLADDLPRNIMGAYGSQAGVTPLLDRLASGGVLFTRAYTTSPLCTPSRFALLTGRYASTAVRVKPTGPSPSAATVRPVAFQTYLAKKDNVTTLAHVLRKAGYLTGFLGKYHVGHPLHPTDCGFDSNADEKSHACAPTRNRSCLREAIKRHAGFDFVSDVYYDNDALEADAHQPEWMALEARGFLAKARQHSKPSRAPFFLLVAPTLTHSPSDVSRQLRAAPRAAPAGCDSAEERGGTAHAGFVEYAAALRRRLESRLLAARLLCPAKAAESGQVEVCAQPAAAAGLIQAEPWLPASWFDGAERAGQGWLSSLATSAVLTAWLDASLEPIFDDLTAAGEANHTLTIFTADHGAFFAGKGHAYEAGIRVPLLMHWPDGLPRPQTVSSRVTHLDVLPTLASLAGVPADPRWHGSSLEALWREGGLDARRDEPPLLVEVGYSRAVVHGEWKLIVVALPSSGEGGCRTIHGFPLPNATSHDKRRTRVKFLYDALERHPAHYCDREQLYDLRRDAAEQSNVAAAMPAKVESLSQLLHAHLRRVEPDSSAVRPQPRRRRRRRLEERSPAGGAKPHSWCQSCHPRSDCPAWPEEAAAAAAAAAALAPAAAEELRRGIDELLAEVDAAISPQSVALAARSAAVRSKCVLLRGTRGHLLVDFLDSGYEHADFALGSCYPSRHANFLHSRLHTALRLVARTLHRHRDAADFDVALCPDDCPPALGGAAGARPALTSVSCAAHKSLPFISWIVNVERATDLSEWDEYLRTMWSPAVPWEARLPKAVFRGRLRAYSYCHGWQNWSAPRYREPITAESWRTLGRAAIWSARERSPELFDVNFGNHEEMAEAWKLTAEQAAARDEPNSLSMSEQARRFRYMVHAEGACGSSDRLKQSYAAPVLLLKQAAPCHEWFERFFRPWVHYVPVDGNFLNLSDAVRWAKAHDAEAQQIVAAANARVLQFLSVQATYTYAEHLLLSYAKTYASRASPRQRPTDGNFTHEFSCKYLAGTTICSLDPR